MTSTTEPATTDGPVTRQDALPLPRIARYALVASAELAPALTAIGLLLDPEIIGLSGNDMVRHLSQHLDEYAVQSWLAPVVAVLWIPAILTIGRVARTAAPTLGLAGLVLAFGLALPIGPDSYELAYVGLSSGLDTESTYRLLVAAESLPAAMLGWAGLLGILGILVLGVAILRGKSAPPWTAIALIVGALAIPVTWISSSAIAGVTAWVLITIGFGGVAHALLPNRK